MNTDLLLTTYLSDTSLLVINKEGAIRRLYTPFRVQCITAVEGLAEGSWVYVDLVRKDAFHRLTYNIHGRSLPYHHFRIHIKF